MRKEHSEKFDYNILQFYENIMINKKALKNGSQPAIYWSWGS